MLIIRKINPNKLKLLNLSNRLYATKKDTFNNTNFTNYPLKLGLGILGVGLSVYQTVKSVKIFNQPSTPSKSEDSQEKVSKENENENELAKSDSKSNWDNWNPINWVPPLPSSITDRMKSLSKPPDASWDEFNKKLTEHWESMSKSLPNLNTKWSELSKSLPNPMDTIGALVDSTINTMLSQILNEKRIDRVLELREDEVVHPELNVDANVRWGKALAAEEEAFITARKRYMKSKFAKFIGVPENEIHEDDIPIVSIAGSGGGYRAMVSTLGFLTSAQNRGLLDCTTYVAGVSGSCWCFAQLYSICQGDILQLNQHIKTRITVPVDSYKEFVKLIEIDRIGDRILSELIYKHNSDQPISMVDLFGTLLTSRLLVSTSPSGRETLDWRSLKLSKQADLITDGHLPLPIYTCIRHEIIEEDKPEDKSEKQMKLTHDFQWFEFTPFEFGTYDFGIWIPSFSFGRQFEHGNNVERTMEKGLGSLMGVYGSAFCATVSHILDEVITALPGGVGSWMAEALGSYRDEAKAVHPIAPTAFHNPFYSLDKDRLAKSYIKRSDIDFNHRHKLASGLSDAPLLSLMDAGMDNNLPLYPLMRPEREVDVVIVMDASDDIVNQNWFERATDYSTNRGFRHWNQGQPEFEKNKDGGVKLKSLVISPDEATESEVSCMDVIYFPLLPNPGYDPEFKPAQAGFCSTYNFQYSSKDTDKLKGLTRSLLDESIDTVKERLLEVYLRKRKQRLTALYQGPREEF